MKTNKLLVLVIALVLILSVFAGCANDEVTSNEGGNTSTEATEETTPEENPEIVLSRWAGPHADDQKTVCADYMYADILIDDIDYGNLKQKQMQSMSASGDYDLVWAQEIWMPEYIEKGWLLPLNDLVEANGIDLSVYSSAMVEMNSVDGELYALPTFAQTLILTYNKEWFDREGQNAPTTVEELVAVAKYFKEQGTGIAIPASQGMAAADLFAQLLYSAGGDYFDADGNINMLSEEALYAAKLWDELCMYSIDGSIAWHHDNVSQAIREEVAPFGITVTGLAFLDSDPESSKIVDKVAYAPIPGKELVSGLVSYWSWGVAANTENPDAAFNVAAWLTSPEVEKKQALMNSQITAISSLADDSEVVAQIPFLPAASTTLENAKTQPTAANAAVIFEPLMAALSEIASTDADPAEVMADLQDKLEEVYVK